MAVTKKMLKKISETVTKEYDIGAMACNVETDPEHRFVTDEEKQKWNKGSGFGTITGILVPLTGWTKENDYYTNTLNVSQMKERFGPVFMNLDWTGEEEPEYWGIQESYGYIFRFDYGDGSIKLYARGKATTDFSIKFDYIVKGEEG